MAEIIINGAAYRLSLNMHDCGNNLHSFKSNKTLQKQGLEKGRCRYCRLALIDWDRLYKKDIRDIAYTKSAFKREMIRHCFWALKTPTPDMIGKIKKYPAGKLEEIVERRLRATLRKPRSQNAYDGRQTPIGDDNLIHWAQHATGSCCRACLEQWYGIDAEAEITDGDYRYIREVVMAYIAEKMNAV